MTSLPDWFTGVQSRSRTTTLSGDGGSSGGGSEGRGGVAGTDTTNRGIRKRSRGGGSGGIGSGGGSGDGSEGGSGGGAEEIALSVGFPHQRFDAATQATATG